jgi:hypothetical protein
VSLHLQHPEQVVDVVVVDVVDVVDVDVVDEMIFSLQFPFPSHSHWLAPHVAQGVPEDAYFRMNRVSTR